MKMKVQWIGLMTFLFPTFANADIFHLDVEPIIGYERVQLLLPTPHTTNRLIYGGRITAGVMIFSAEAEYTRGTNQETYTTSSVTHTGDRLKAGLRSGFNLGMLFRFFLRAGGQAALDKTETTVAGVTSVSYRPLTISPYAGAGIRMKLGRQLSASVQVVAVIPDFSNLSQNEYQTTAVVSLP